MIIYSNGRVTLQNEHGVEEDYAEAHVQREELVTLGAPPDGSGYGLVEFLTDGTMKLNGVHIRDPRVCVNGTHWFFSYVLN